MTEEKTFVFPESNKMDSGTLLALMNNRGNEGFGGNWLWVIFLFFLYGWGGRGFGNGSGLGNEINNDYGRSVLLQAINGNGQAINQLASTLNCDINSVQTAINSVQSAVQNVGCQVGMSGQQVINAIQAGNQTLASQIAQCCCDTRLLITNQGYENQIRTAEQTNILGSKIDVGTAAVTNAIANQTNLINDKFCQLEMREMQSKIDALSIANATLRSNIDNANQTAAIQAYINAEIAPLRSDVASIKCATPSTVTIPYSPVVGVPTCLAAQYGYLPNTNIWA